MIPATSFPRSYTVSDLPYYSPINSFSAPDHLKRSLICPFFHKLHSHRHSHNHGHSRSCRRVSAAGKREVVSSNQELTNSNIDAEEDHSSNVQSLGQRWREMQGSNNWHGLLNPLDPDLRTEIIRYGEFAQACYDGFDYDSHSRYCGSCKYDKWNFFEQVGLPKAGYTITRYIYATSKSDMELNGFFKRPEGGIDPWSKHSNWMGYIAVCTSEEEIKRLGRRDIVVAWRGTVTKFEWMENLKDILTPYGLDQEHAKVERGFLHLYTCKNRNSMYNKFSAREQVLFELRRLINMYPDDELSITVTGHSLGGALALINAYDIAESGLSTKCKNILTCSCHMHAEPGHLRPIFQATPETGDLEKVPVTMISFSAPRVGNEAFKKRCEDLKVKALRIVNEKDVVPKMPGLLFNERFKLLRKLIDDLPWTYSHVGSELILSSDLSPFLQPTPNVIFHHNLEAHLHLLDGFHGFGKKFQSSTDRDPALVNKASNFLRKELGIPPFWWQPQHKGLIRNEKGKWVQPERDDEEFHESHPEI